MIKYHIKKGTPVYLFRFQDMSVPGRYTHTQSAHSKFITELPVTYDEDEEILWANNHGAWIERQMQLAFNISRRAAICEHSIFKLPENCYEWMWLVVHIQDVEWRDTDA